MNINTPYLKKNNRIINPNIVYFYKFSILSPIINREFSSVRVLFKPSREDVSVFSDDTTEKDLQEHQENQTRKMAEFKDRHSDDEIYAKTAIFDNMDKDSAEALRDEIRSDLISDTAKLKEELREDVGEIIDTLNVSVFKGEALEKLIARERDHLKVNLEEADKVCDDRLWSLDDSWSLSKHAEVGEMSSVGSYSDNDSNNNEGNSENGNNSGNDNGGNDNGGNDNGGNDNGGNDNGGNDNGGNDNGGNDNGGNEGNANSDNSGSDVSNIDNRNINSELSPIDFVIQKEACISIYDIEILDLYD
jgi:hypothetical protein